MIALLLVAVAAPSPESLAQLVDRVAATYAAKPGVVVRQAGSVTSEMHAGPGAQVRLFAPPDKLRIEIAWPGEPKEVRVLDGARAWRQGVEVTGQPPGRAMQLQAARMALPRALEEAKLADRGEEQRDGMRVREVEATFPDGSRMFIQIDLATAHIVRTRSLLPAGPGFTVEFMTDYSDFRRVDGMLFAFREDTWASGRKTGATVLEKAELLKAAPAGAFKP